MSKTFREKFIKTLKESIFVEDELTQPKMSYPYLDKVAEYLEIDRNEMYNFFGNSLAYQTLDELEKDKANDDIDEKEYEIHKKFFDKFGKDEFALTDEDLALIGSSRDDFENAHNDLT